jgi:hypothetical protein
VGVKVGFGGAASGLAGAAVCPFGQEEVAAGLCIDPVCPSESDVYSYSEQACRSNDCVPVGPNDVEWSHLWGDCVGKYDGAFEDEVDDAILFAAQRLYPAARMARIMVDSAGLMVGIGDGVVISYAEYLWNFGYRSAPSSVDTRDPSLLAWFGPYTPYKAELVHLVLTYGTARVVKNFDFATGRIFEPEPGVSYPPWPSSLDGSTIKIRCWNWGACSGGDAYATAGSGLWGSSGIINLCPEWLNPVDPDTGEPRSIDDAKDEQGRDMIHELLHWSLVGRISNFPRDVKDSDCPFAAGTLNKCYGTSNAAWLAENLGNTRWNWDQDRWDWIETPAAFNNIDNWVAWLANRQDEWEDCALPYGSAVI